MGILKHICDTFNIDTSNGITLGDLVEQINVRIKNNTTEDEVRWKINYSIAKDLHTIAFLDGHNDEGIKLYMVYCEYIGNALCDRINYKIFITFHAPYYNIDPVLEAMGVKYKIWLNKDGQIEFQ